MSLNALRIVLITRSIFSFACAGYLLLTRPTTTPELLAVFAPYAVADGIGEWLSTGLAARLGMRLNLVTIAVIVGLIRIGAGLAIWLGPGIPYFAVTLLIFVGVLGTLGFLSGILELLEARRLRSAAGGQPTARVLTAAGIATVVLSIFTVVLLPLEPTLARLMVAGALLEALVLLLAARHPDPEPASRPESTARS